MQSDLKYKYDNEYRRLKLMLPDFVNEYIDYESDKELRTKIAYLRDIKIFLSFISEEVLCKEIIDISPSDLENISERDVRNYMDNLGSYQTTYKSTKKDKQSAKEVKVTFTNEKSGINRKIATLKSFFKVLNDRNIVNNNPVFKIKTKEEQKRFINTYLDNHEIQLLIDTVENGIGVNKDNSKEYKAYTRWRERDLCIVLLLSYTGIRISELVQLNIDDVNINLNTIIIHRKGGYTEELPYSDLISDTLYSFILKRKELNKDLEKLLAKQKGDTSIKPTKYANLKALFISQQHTRITDKSVRNILEKYTTRAEIEKKVTCHTLRRTFLTTLYNDTGDIMLVQKIAGHSSPNTTQKFYTDLKYERMKDEMFKFKYK